jgi:hypothetical protein
MVPGQATERLTELSGTLDTASVEAGRPHLLVQRRRVIDTDRADQNCGGHSPVSVGYVAGDVVEISSKGVCDLGRGAIEAGLQVVGAEHDHDDIEGLVGLEARNEVLPPVAARDIVVVDVRGATVQALLDDVEPFSEKALQDPCPAAVGREPHIVQVIC